MNKSRRIQLDNRSQCLRYLRVSVLMLTVASGILPVFGATEATLEINWTVVAPSCELVLPDRYYLGGINNGTTVYAPYIFSVNCKSPSKTSVFAETLTGLVTGSVDTSKMTGTSAQLWFEENNKKITLNGDGPSATYFCSGSNTRQCSLIPNTWVNIATSDKMDTEAVIKFTLRYEA